METKNSVKRRIKRRTARHLTIKEIIDAVNDIPYTDYRNIAAITFLEALTKKYPDTSKQLFDYKIN